MKKIYIIGPTGSGKTTLSRKLSKKYEIKSYELDKAVWDDNHGNIRRPEEETLKIFNDIIKKHSWIIEDIGRNIFSAGREQADVIYYLKMSKSKAYIRVIKRWLKQRLGKENYNRAPTFNQLLYFISIVNSYYKKEKKKLESLQLYNDKVIYLKKRDIKRLLSKKE